MIYLAIALLLVFIGWASTIAFRRIQSEKNPSWQELSDRRQQSRVRLQAFVEEFDPDSALACAAVSVHKDSASLYALLKSGKLEEGLEMAEQKMAASRSDGGARLLLAHALLAKGDLAAAEAMQESASVLDQPSAYGTYLASRIELASYLKNAAEGSKSSPNDLLTPIELLALELHTKLGDKGDASALWLPGEGGEVPKEEARAFTLAHFSGYYRLLDTTLDSLGGAPFADGIYLLARLAMKCGFSEEGAALMLCIEER